MLKKTILAALAAATLTGAVASPAAAYPWGWHRWHHWHHWGYWHHRHWCRWHRCW